MSASLPGGDGPLAHRLVSHRRRRLDLWTATATSKAAPARSTRKTGWLHPLLRLVLERARDQLVSTHRRRTIPIARPTRQEVPQRPLLRRACRLFWQL